MSANELSGLIKICKFIAKGGEGGVMQCEIDNVDISLALKMRYNYGQSTNSYKNLCTEAEILKNIPKHPNIIFLIHDFFARPTEEMISSCIEDIEVRQAMIKEYNAHSGEIEYRTSLFLLYKIYPLNLSKWSLEQRKNCQMVDIIRICYEISCGVLHLWEHGIVHRDLKLENILMDGEGHVVIIDFGLAVKLRNNKANVDRLGGNQAHLAPEILNSSFPGEVDYSKQPSFAMGVLFHEIIMGYHPFGNYPWEAGSKPNINVPVLNSEKMKLIKDPVDDILIAMICKLVCSSPFDRMNLQDANNILSELLLQCSQKLFIYNSSKYFLFNTMKICIYS